MRLKRVIAAVVLSMGLATAAVAQVPSPLSIVSVDHHGEGIDHVFTFEVANASDRVVTTRGRLVVINVYDASLPSTIPIRDLAVPASGRATAVVRWGDAPLMGQVRALLVLNDGQHASLVESYSFLIFPLAQVLMFVAAVALAAAATLTVMRLPKYLKTRVPADMMPYVVEYDDTVVTLSNRFDVTWQDIVRANRLKPPYDLKPGARVFIPKHDLRRPESPPEA